MGRVNKVYNAKRVKKSIGGRLVDGVTSTGYDMWGHIIHDVLIPTIKDSVIDSAMGMLEIAMFGERKKKTWGNSYHNRFRSGGYNSKSQSFASRSSVEVDEVKVSDRREAESILNSLQEIIDEYGTVSVADFYNTVGERTVPTDSRFGWTSINNAKMRRVPDGYVITLPRPKEI